MSAVATPNSGDYCTCPYCSGTIKKVAIKCRHCGKLLGGDGQVGNFRLGKTLIAGRKALLPQRCIKSNGPVDCHLVRSLTWHPRYIFALLILFPLLGPFPYIIGALATQKRVRVHIPLSSSQFRRRRATMILSWLLGLGGIVAFIAGLAVGGIANDRLMGGLLLGGLGAAITGLVLGRLFERPVSATRIDDDYVWLKGAHPEYLDELPAWLGGG